MVKRKILVDSMGRTIVRIPAYIREELKLKDRDEVNVSLNGNMINIEVLHGKIY